MESKPTRNNQGLWHVIHRGRASTAHVYEQDGRLLWELPTGRIGDVDVEAGIVWQCRALDGHDTLALQAELLQLRAEAEANRWRKWPEERPEVSGSEFLVLNSRGQWRSALYTDPQPRPWMCVHTDEILEDVTHWKPVTPPKEAPNVEAK